MQEFLHRKARDCRPRANNHTVWQHIGVTKFLEEKQSNQAEDRQQNADTVSHIPEETGHRHT